MIKSAQYPVVLASIVAILIGTQSFDAAIAQTRVENPNLKVELFAQGSNSTHAPILHIITLTLDTVANVPWGSSINVAGKLTDNAASGAAVGGKTITFTGTGAAQLASETTNIDGTFTAKGKAPSTLATGWTVQAHFVGDSVHNAADSNSQSYNTLKHMVSLTSTSLALNVPWTSPTSFPVILADLNCGNAPISGRTIQFNGTGVINVADKTTDNAGRSNGTGIAPSTVSSGWSYQAQFAGDSLYNAANTNLQTYSTLKHTASITLDTITYVPSGMTVTVTGKLTDSSVSYAAIGSQTITFTGTGAANLANVVTKPDGSFAASGKASNSIATGWTIQAHYSGNVNYMSSDSNTQSYNTLK
jgi:hypothetical protein